MGRPLLTGGPRGPSDRLLDEGALRALLWALLVVLFLPDVLRSAATMSLAWDDHYFAMHEEAARQTILEHGQLPVWNPWYCGGIPGLANPQDTSLGPDFLLRLLFGTSVGRRLTIVLFFVLALEGMYRLARRCGAAGLGALLAAVLFATCGRFTQFVHGGWLNFMTLALLPALVLTLLRAQRDVRWAVATGLLMAWLVLSGGTYSAPYSALVLGFVTLERVVAALAHPDAEGPRWWRPLLVLAIAGAVAAAASAIRLLPLLEVIREHPRNWVGDQGTPPGELVYALFTSPGEWISGLDTYLGPLAAVLALLGVLHRARAGRVAALGAILFFALAAGDQGPLSPYRLLQSLPLLGQLRSSHRLLLVTAFFISLGAGLGVTLLQGLPARLLARRAEAGAPTARLQAWVAAAGLGLALVASALAAQAPLRVNRLWEGRIYAAEHPLQRARGAFRQTLGNRWDAFHFPLADRGILACYEETAFPMSARLRPDLSAEEVPADPTVAFVERLRWSPHRLVLRVEALAPTTVLINQNHHPRWVASVGEVRSNEGLLAVDVPAGAHTLVLNHRPGLAAIGAPISLATLLLGLLLGLGALGRRTAAAWARWRAMPW